MNDAVPPGRRRRAVVVTAVLVLVALVATITVLRSRTGEEAGRAADETSWASLSSGDYRIAEGPVLPPEALDAVAEAANLADWQEEYDVYLLEGNGGYFHFCGTAYAMADDERFLGVPATMIQGVSADDEVLIAEFHGFEFQGVDGARILESLASAAAGCDEYVREAPGWSFNDPSQRVIDSVESGPMCDEAFASLRVSEHDQGQNNRIDYVYLVSGNRMALIYIGASDGELIEPNDGICETAARYFATTS